MKLLIINPQTGRATDYDTRYLNTEARHAAKRAGGRMKSWFIRVVDGGNTGAVCALVVDVLEKSGMVSQTSVAI